MPSGHPGNYTTLTDVTRIEGALREQSLVVDESQLRELKKSLGEVESGIAKSIPNNDGNLSFVPRSFEGVQRLEQNVPFDLVSPNGVSRLLVARGRSATGLDMTVDGEVIVRRAKVGENFTVEFGDQKCRFEVISLDGANTGGPVTVRITCA